MPFVPLFGFNFLYFVLWQVLRTVFSVQLNEVQQRITTDIKCSLLSSNHPIYQILSRERLASYMLARHLFKVHYSLKARTI